MDSLAQFGVPEKAPACWQCESFVPVGEKGTGVCRKALGEWEDRQGGWRDVTPARTLDWVSRNYVTDYDEACVDYVES